MTISQIDKVYSLVGRIALSWNKVDLLWYLIVTCLMKETPRQQIDAIFHIFQTGATQRGFIMTVAGTLPEDDAVRIRLGQLNSQTNDAAGNRNAAIHAELIAAYPDRFLGGVGVVVAPGPNPNPKKNRFAGKHLETELTKAVTEIETLIADLDAFRHDLAPKLTIRADILADMLRRGLQPPSWVVQTGDLEPQGVAQPPQPLPPEPQE